MSAKSGNRSIQKPLALAPGQTEITVGASVTGQVISKPFALVDGLNLRIDLRHAAVTGTCTVTLQVSPGPDVDIDGALQWQDAKAATLTVGAPLAYSNLTLLATRDADKPYLPLPQIGRLLITTAGASGCTISKITVLS
jgi:hypothetical protein